MTLGPPEQHVEELAQERRRHQERELLFGEIVETISAMLASQEITQRELAQRLGVSEARVSHLLRGNENLTLKSVADLGWAVGLRFSPTPAPIRPRSQTPARSDPPPPAWVKNLGRQLSKRRG